MACMSAFSCFVVNRKFQIQRVDEKDNKSFLTHMELWEVPHLSFSNRYPGRRLSPSPIVIFAEIQGITALKALARISAFPEPFT
jgi:hypothetical protein